MTINELEAKCRVAIEYGDERETFDPRLVLQLIEERRLLARLAGYTPITHDERLEMQCLRDRVLQEAAECKST